MNERRYKRCAERPCPFGWAIFRDALQSAAEDLPELWWHREVGWVVSWD